MKAIDLLQDKWTTDRAREVYGVDSWAAGYFRVAESGEVCVCPDAANPDASASLTEIIGGLRERGQAFRIHYSPHSDDRSEGEGGEKKRIPKH